MDEAAVSFGESASAGGTPTDHLTEVVKFYREGLGFEVLYEFNDHDGFDGIMLDHKGAAYHLEFTRKRSHTAGSAPTEDNLLVFYLPDEAEWKQAIQRLEGVAIELSRHSTRIGTSRGRRSKIQMDIGWCCRMRAGLRLSVVIVHPPDELSSRTSSRLCCWTIL
jgi:catechol 2,3-dioxygenase-like lactoylglutathione lyase family enzyme